MKDHFPRLLFIAGVFVMFCLFYACREAKAAPLPQAPSQLPQAPEMPKESSYRWKSWRGTKNYLSLCENGKEIGMYDRSKATYHPVKERGVYGAEAECPCPIPSENCKCDPCECTPEDHCGCMGKVKVAS